MKKVTMLMFVLVGFSLGSSAYACGVSGHKAKSTAPTTSGSSGTQTINAPAK
ncbi:MAG TPA: hypothetical protein VFW53_03415 [Gallionella sp.]|nr:hypothetical protein [Gallionella sp.]